MIRSRIAKSPWARYALVFVAVWLAAQIIRQGATDHFVTSNPVLAVLWQPDSTGALTALAQRRLLARDYAHATVLAKKALARSPLNVEALSTLGAALAERGNPEQADAIMKLAGGRGWRDVLTQFWLFHAGMVAARYDSAFSRGDALLRRLDPNFDIPFFAVMAREARDPHAIEPLAAVLGRDPSWRFRFLGYLASDTSPQSGTIALLLMHALAWEPTPPRDQEISLYLKRLVKEGKYGDAALAFQSLSRAVPRGGEYVVDGTFSGAHEIEPFGWTLSDGIGWTALITEAPRDRNGRALRVQYDGYSTAPPLRQLLVLPHGEYRLEGESFPESPADADRFHWVVSCVGDGQVLASAAPESAGSNQWHKFAVALQVPDANCPAQWLELKAKPGDLREDIIVWYDGISIRSSDRGRTSSCCARTPALRAED